ncbi:TonB-dependent receptor [Dasania marina]|uniref:TonB-dependent receptor n=1 Tax=Dasania marina TaxID=471499 RepID=UPI0003687707|nr:TonB-dependent receptor [Dasania marina]
MNNIKPRTPDAARLQLKALYSALILCAALPAQASVLEEVVVTAQKREQNIQDVGVSVAAFSGKQMDSLGWSNSEDIAAQTPGMVATSTSGDSNVTIYSIRGINQSDFNEHQEAPIALYADGSYLSSPGNASVPMFDMNRVEILRGPQGTMFGRNATGGLIHLISNKPSEEFEAYVDLTLAEYNQVQVSAAVSGPLTDKMQGRFAVFNNTHDGYIKNNIGPDLRESDNTAFRTMLNIDIDDSSSLLLKLHGNIVDHAKGGVFEYRASEVGPDGFSVFCDGCGTFLDHDNDGNFDNDDGDGEALEGSFNRAGEVYREVYGTSATYIKENEDFTFTSITDYLTLNKDYEEESDGTSVDRWIYFAGARIDQYSQELRLNGENDTMRWATGLYYLQIENDFYGGFPAPAFDYYPRYDASLETTTWSVFGQVEYDLSESLMLTAGLRWTDDKKEMDFQMTQCDGLLGEFCPLTLPAADSDPLLGFLVDGRKRQYSRHDGDYSGKIQLDWRPDFAVDSLIYSGISRGTKGGSFNAPLDGFLSDAEIAFEPEILTSYEIGYKGTLIEDKLRLNAAVFYYDYSDYQAFLFVGNTSQIVNKEADIKGAEIELVITPGDGWDILLGLSKLDATVHDIDVNGTLYDQDIILSPDLTANATIRKAWAISSGAELSAQITASYVDDQFFNTVNHDTIHADSYTLYGMRLGYVSADEKWSTSLFVDNLTDKRYRNFGFDISAFDNFTILSYGKPRWAGVNIKYQF